MDPVNTSIDTNKHLHDKLESIEHLHDTKHATEDHGMSDKYDVDFLNLQKSPSNGLLDSYHENISPEIDQVHAFLSENNAPDQSTPSSKETEISDSVADALKNEAFCGTDKLNVLSDYVVNDDVEVFIPSKNVPEKPSLLDFDPLTDSVYNPEDDFRSYTDASPVTRTPQSIDDTVEPVTNFKEVQPSETLASVEPTVKSDKDIGDKFKEIIDDSPRTGTPDFLELDSDDLKPIDVKTESVKAAETKPADTKPIDKPAEVKPPEPKPIEKVPEKVAEVKKEEKPKVEYFQDKPEIGPKEIFSKYGLDIWFKPERLNPTVEAFIYWRDPKLSAIVFVSGLVLLLSMAYYSLISVVANTGLTILVLAMGFRIYKHVLQAVQKTDQGHPYSVFLEWDLKVPQEKVHELVDTVLIHINAYVSELRRLFLIENWMESVRFAVVLWVLTYVGSWFNGLTLVIIAFVSLFTLPKVYENNKVQIDQNLALVHAKLEELTNKIKDVLPALLRKKLPEKKE